jgi:hypothetical protein
MQRIARKLALGIVVAATAACGVDQADDPATDSTDEALQIAAATSSSIVRTSGSRAGEAFFNPGSPPYIDLYDAKCDNHQVYVEYQQNGGFNSRFYNGDGCGTTKRVYLADGKGQVVYWAFVQIQLGTDVQGARAIDFDW